MPACPVEQVVPECGMLIASFDEALTVLPQDAPVLDQREVAEKKRIQHRGAAHSLAPLGGSLEHDRNSDQAIPFQLRRVQGRAEGRDANHRLRLWLGVIERRDALRE